MLTGALACQQHTAILLASYIVQGKAVCFVFIVHAYDHSEWPEYSTFLLSVCLLNACISISFREHDGRTIAGHYPLSE